ncbi:MAG: DUF4430 domain-containing protein [Candidatus Doudnabacteria bacterium]|nr:DUF4430 domain-containing protein [Candidatus Doudnabacteria bacterium]
MKKIFIVLTILGAVITVTQIRAANLAGAVSTLPQNEEWSLMARSAIGQNTGQTFLRSRITDGSALDYEKRILAITAQGQNPRSWGEENFVEKLLSKYNGSQMGDTSLLNDDIFGLLALNSVGESGDVINKIRSHVLANQNSDGGWSFFIGGGSDSNTTAMTVAALETTGSAPGSAINYLKSTQNNDGGYGFTPNIDSDGASTAWVIIGLHSASAVSDNAVSYLESLQLSNGTFKWKSSDSNGSTLVTAYAVIALSGKTLPIGRVSATVPPNPTPTPSPAPNPAPPASPDPAPVFVNNSQCFGISALNSVQTGQNFTASVSMRNNGSKNWSTGYFLGSQNPQDNNIWTISRVNLPTTQVVPGQTSEFTFTSQAPSQPGNYTFAWKMVEEHVQWFGETCATDITVLGNTDPTPPMLAPLPVPTPTPVPPQLTDPANTYLVTINYPDNKIYVDNVIISSNRALDTLKTAAADINLMYEIRNMSFGPFVYSINGYIPSGSSGWQYAVNGTVPALNSSDYALNPGDRVQWFFGAPNSLPY